MGQKQMSEVAQNQEEATAVDKTLDIEESIMESSGIWKKPRPVKPPKPWHRRVVLCDADGENCQPADHWGGPAVHLAEPNPPGAVMEGSANTPWLSLPPLVQRQGYPGRRKAGRARQQKPLSDFL
mmetsp:Transcript_5584/g.10017  ORF Transcript_5584/g.10017 Transcript_5584/m.10017 type:complete len:125 (+) Transcript_5584:150-524(+)